MTEERTIEMAGHTPTPWYICEHNTGGHTGHDLDIETRPGGWFMRLSPGYPIDMAHFPDPNDVLAEFEANAAFTMRAVNNHDALNAAAQSALAWFIAHRGEIERPNAPESGLSRVIDGLEKALAKAEGK